MSVQEFRTSTPRVAHRNVGRLGKGKKTKQDTLHPEVRDVIDNFKKTLVEEMNKSVSVAQNSSDRLKRPI